MRARLHTTTKWKEPSPKRNFPEFHKRVTYRLCAWFIDCSAVGTVDVDVELPMPEKCVFIIVALLSNNNIFFPFCHGFILGTC